MAYLFGMASEPTTSQLVRYYVVLSTIAMNLIFEAWKVLLHVGS